MYPGFKFYAHFGKQRFPFRGIRQMPTFRAYATHPAGKFAFTGGAAFLFGPSNRCRPSIETTVLGAITFIFIESPTTPAIIYFIVQILRHPNLRTYRHIPIKTAVTIIAKMISWII